MEHKRRRSGGYKELSKNAEAGLGLYICGNTQQFIFTSIDFMILM